MAGGYTRRQNCPPGVLCPPRLCATLAPATTLGNQHGPSFDLPAPNTAAPALFTMRPVPAVDYRPAPLVTSEQLEALLGQVLAVDAASLSAAERLRHPRCAA